MTAMEKVAQIKADIAALPAEYRALVQEEQTWAKAHPVLYALILMGVGAVLALVAAHFVA